MIVPLRKISAGIAIAALCLLTAPEVYATASGSVISDPITEAMTTATNVVEQFMKKHEMIMKPIAAALRRSLLTQIRKDTVKWIQNDFKTTDANGRNVSGPFIPADYERWARNAGDKVGGQFVDDLIGQATNGKFSLCQIPSFKIGLSLPSAEPFEIQTKCSLSAGKNAWQDTYNKAAAGDWLSWLEISRPENNPNGQMLLAWEEKNRRVDAEKTKQQTDLQVNRGVLSLREHSEKTDPACVDNCQTQPYCKDKTGWNSEINTENCQNCIQSCVTAGSDKITTPGEQINNQLSEALGSGWKDLEATKDINEVVGALAQYALDKLKSGLTSRDGSSSPKYSSIESFTGSSSLNQKYARYKNYSTTEFQREFDKAKDRLYKYKIVKNDSAFSATYTDADGNEQIVDKSHIGGFKIITGPGSYYDWPEIDFLRELAGGTASGMASSTLRGGLVHTLEDGTYAYSLRGIMSNDPVYKNDKQLRLECDLGPFGGRKDEQEALNTMNSELSTIQDKISTIENFFSNGGMYESYLQTIQNAEEALKGFATTPDSSLQQEAGDNFMSWVDIIEKIKSQVPDYHSALADRTATYAYFQGSNPFAPGISKSRQMHCWILSSSTNKNLFPHFTETHGPAYAGFGASASATEAAANACAAKYDKENISKYLYLNDVKEDIKAADIPTADRLAAGLAGGASSQCYNSGEREALAASVVSQCGGSGSDSVSITIQKYEKTGSESRSDYSCKKHDVKVSCGNYLKADCQYMDLTTVSAGNAEIQSAQYDTYGPTNNGSKADTCDGNDSSQYTCQENDDKTCIDSWKTADVSGGGGNVSNGGGNISPVKTTSQPHWREVTCVPGAGVDPNANAAAGSGHGGPTYMCAPGKPPTPHPGTGENYYRVAGCTSFELCDTYYPRNTPGAADCYADVSLDKQYGRDEHAMIHALDNLCFHECTNALDDGVTTNAAGLTWGQVGYHANGSGRYDCHNAHKDASGSGC